MERNNRKIKDIGGWVELNENISIDEYSNYFKRLNEATSERAGGSGGYIPPIQPGMREFEKNQLGPFVDGVSDFKSPLVAYDSYDKQWDLRRDQIINLEKIAKKVTDYIKKHPYSTFSDEDGNPLNPTPSGKLKKPPYNLEIVPITRIGKNKINEITTTTTAGEYNGPQELGIRKWTKSELGPYSEESNHPANINQKKNCIVHGQCSIQIMFLIGILPLALFILGPILIQILSDGRKKSLEALSKQNKSK
jgi:hypothetical protein